MRNAPALPSPCALPCVTCGLTLCGLSRRKTHRLTNRTRASPSAPLGIYHRFCEQFDGGAVELLSIASPHSYSGEIETAAFVQGGASKETRPFASAVMTCWPSPRVTR